MINLVTRCDGCQQNSIVISSSLGEIYLRTRAKNSGWTTDKAQVRILGENVDAELHYCKSCSKIRRQHEADRD